MKIKIYTKTGDKGLTSLFGGSRVLKNSKRIKAYGTVDEANSVIGKAIATKPNKKVISILRIIQNDLFVVGADLATTKNNLKVLRISNLQIEQLEKFIDEIEMELPQLKKFILPSGSIAGAELHFARTVTRRAEIEVVELSQSEKINEDVIIYLNRLSDLLFVLARYENLKSKVKEIIWE